MVARIVASLAEKLGPRLKVDLKAYAMGLRGHICTLVDTPVAATAAAIVARRNEKGAFRSRADLREVPRLGPKAFEQAAGFLRIRDGAHPLDASAVHPERYALVERMAADVGATVADLMRDDSITFRRATRRLYAAHKLTPEVAFVIGADGCTDLDPAALDGWE